MNLNHILALPLENVMQSTYVWIDGNYKLRSKSRTLNINEPIPDWDFDGSSTNQAPNDKTEILLKPIAKFKDPFRNNGLLILCDTYNLDGTPQKTNNRNEANKIFEGKKEEEPWFGIEQEFFLLHKKFNIHHMKPQGPYYCSVGTENCLNRNIMEYFYRAALYAGIKVSGINAEVAPCQWEFQIGPCVGIEEGDHLWMARYILERITENFHIKVEYSPKPFKNWNGSGAHTNFSTKKMREEGGLDEIIKVIEKLEINHGKMIPIYGGEDNKLRLTGTHETSDWRRFSWGYADRTTTVRVGTKTKLEKKGYMELRAVASNIDPYIITSKIVQMTCG